MALTFGEIYEVVGVEVCGKILMVERNPGGRIRTGGKVHPNMQTAMRALNKLHTDPKPRNNRR